MFWAADIRRAAYDPETISMLSTVLERAIAALPHQQRTEERKARLTTLSASPAPPLRARLTVSERSELGRFPRSRSPSS